MKALTFENIGERVASISPGTRALLDEQLARNGECLQHMLFGDLTRYVSAISSGRTTPEQSEELKAILDLLDEALASDDIAVKELVVVSFLENLSDPEDRRRFRAFGRKKLIEELNMIWGPG